MRDLDSLVDQALQEEYEKAQREGAIPWNDAEPAESVAWDRAETDPCERGTPGCSVRHTRDSECQTW